MSPIQIYTDGAFRHQPKALGAWCCLVFDQHKAQLKAEIDTRHNVTNNRMELTAVINALQLCEPKANVQLYTDSQYVLYGIKYGNNKTNQDLWSAFQQLLTQKQVQLSVEHVYGHQTNRGNNVVDLTMRRMLNLVIKQNVFN